jgi:chemotaxis protein MotB
VSAPIIVIKKVVKGHGGHGAAWKVAYADFVTAMMALFMVMWLLAQTDKEQQKELSEYFRTGVFSGAPSILEGGSGLLDKGWIDVVPSNAETALARDAETISGTLKGMAESDPKMMQMKDAINVKVTEEGLLITFTDNNEALLFDVASADLKAPLIHVLQGLGPVLAQMSYKVRIQGHTDARPFPAGSVRSNWSLSFERAEQARRVLQQAGLPEDRLVGVFAHGASAPLDPEHPNAPANRRLSILALPSDFEPLKAQSDSAATPEPDAPNDDHAEPEPAWLDEP